MDGMLEGQFVVVTGGSAGIGRAIALGTPRRGARAVRRIGRPDKIADAVVWLGSGIARFVTGAALAVDGGLSGML